MEHVIYAYYRGHEVVYVGRTQHFEERKNQHRRCSPWWTPDMYVRIIGRHADKFEATGIEANAIRKHKARYNKAWRIDKPRKLWSPDGPQ